MHFDIDDRVALRGFRPEDRQDLVNGLNDWAVTRWLGRVPHPYRLDGSHRPRPLALVRFFEKVSKECGELCDGGSMLASHPSFSERIEALSE